jgi:hypothetical protein
MQNLAGIDNADKVIKKELFRCGINPIVLDKSDGEVKSFIGGELHGFTFYRRWSYWSVAGKMPLEFAEQLYNHPIGKTDIRASGHCGCIEPKDAITWFYGDKVVNSLHTKEIYEKWILEHPETNVVYKLAKKELEDNIFSDDHTNHIPYVMSYDIDTEVGLYIFAEKIKQMKALEEVNKRQSGGF